MGERWQAEWDDIHRRALGLDELPRVVNSVEQVGQRMTIDDRVRAMRRELDRGGHVYDPDHATAEQRDRLNRALALHDCVREMRSVAGRFLRDTDSSDDAASSRDGILDLDQKLEEIGRAAAHELTRLMAEIEIDQRIARLTALRRTFAREDSGDDAA